MEVGFRRLGASAMAAVSVLGALGNAMRHVDRRHNRVGPGRKTMYTYWKNIRLTHAPFVDGSAPNTRQRYRAALRAAAQQKSRKVYGSGRFWRRMIVGGALAQ